jgi:hypothetical protein
MDNAREPTKPLSILNKLLGSKESTQLPSRESLAVVANDFASYFFVKVDSICSSLPYQSMQIFTIGHTELSSFSFAIQHEVCRVILRSLAKSYANMASQETY